MPAPSRQSINSEIIDLPVKRLFLATSVPESVAAAGTTQATATELPERLTIVTAADDVKGVRLPAGARGMMVNVFNAVTDKALLVYPEVGGAINAGTANAAVTVAGGANVTFFCTDALVWATSVPAVSKQRTLTAVTTLTAADYDATIFLNNATGFVTTLPAPVAGFRLEVINKTANTSGNHTLVTASSANIIKGNQNSVAGDAGDFGTGDDTISFVANQSVAGDKVELRSDGTSWFAYAISRVALGITFTTAS